MNPNFMKTLRKWWKPIDWLDVSLSWKVFKYPAEIQKQIEIKQNEMYVREVAKGKKIRDDDLYRVDEIEISEVSCRLSLGIMKWSELFLIKHYPEIWEQLEEKYFSNGIACSALVETSDGFFLFWERSNKYAGRNGWEIGMIGGTLSPDEWKVYSFQWFYDHLLRELHEEAGVWSEYVQDAKMVGIQRMSNGGIAFLYYLSLHVAKNEVDTLFTQEHDGEFQWLQYIPRAEVIGFLKDLCFEHGILKKTMGLQIDYLEEIFSKV